VIGPLFIENHDGPSGEIDQPKATSECTSATLRNVRANVRPVFSPSENPRTLLSRVYR